MRMECGSYLLHLVFREAVEVIPRRARRPLRGELAQRGEKGVEQTGGFVGLAGRGLRTRGAGRPRDATVPEVVKQVEVVEVGALRAGKGPPRARLGGDASVCEELKLRIPGNADVAVGAGREAVVVLAGMKVVEGAALRGAVEEDADTTDDESGEVAEGVARGQQVAVVLERVVAERVVMHRLRA